MQTKFTYNPNYAIHPGETLREKLEEIGMTAKEFANKTAIPIKIITDILNDKNSITPEIAVIFEKKLKIPASFWIKKQANFDKFTKIFEN